MRRVVLVVGVTLAAVVVGGGIRLAFSHGHRPRVAWKPAPTLGTIRGRILAVGGPVVGPRPWSHQPIRLVAARSGRVVYVGHTDVAGRFVAHVARGGYTILLSPGLVVQTPKFGQLSLDHYVVKVTGGVTIRPRIVVTNPLWA